MTTHQERWWGTYRGIHWRIHRTDLDSEYFPSPDAWCFYVTIAKGQVSDEVWVKLGKAPRKRQFAKDSPVRPDYQYSNLPIISDLEWHCGITFYERDFDQWGKPIGVTGGCDYSHLYDNDVSYDFDDVLADAKRCIDSLWEAVPSLKVFCRAVGGFHDTTDGIWSPTGEFLSSKGQDWREAQGWPRIPEKWVTQ